MKHKVLRKQENSRMCLVCGVKNDFGLKASFYELDNGELAGIFTPREEHQSYPGIAHGGISAAILDETIGRAIMVTDRDMLGYTVELNLKYKKHVPLGQKLIVIGRITREKSRTFEGTGEIILANGEVAASATAKYLKVPLDKMPSFQEDSEDRMEWQVNISENDPREIEYEQKTDMKTCLRLG
ncbi:phenylacetic acid degradation-related protein [Syntrophobotulus glycolicus DSM 8271]|uniref:Acyl-coenzyme A thioesterase THEM4 n=1 Tax=Syntrophobotulus glycolicus (strain DSM 8271 / FlGlyR) TaxID=645991 RepID=F0T0G3_SYNGF|nr:PaaI family thioesterase [Syntrophobotulus glycolicus]ADY57335.1 phenylacetic acid degradation-related protein [Syntrophobotulus glycolicus DSM 8271]